MQGWGLEALQHDPKKQLDSPFLSIRPGALVSAVFKVVTFVDHQLEEIKSLFSCHVYKPQLLGTYIWNANRDYQEVRESHEAPANVCSLRAELIWTHELKRRRNALKNLMFFAKLF